jgi:hypothetical protein
MMRLLSFIFAAVALVTVSAAPAPSEAKTYFSFGYYGPGVGIHVGRYPHYYYGYRPYYRPYYYRPYVYRPYRYPRYGGRCAYWSRRCVANWGYRNSNYYGCLRYHRCR